MTYGLIENDHNKRKQYIKVLARRYPGSIIFGYAGFERALKHYIDDRVQIMVIPDDMGGIERIEFENYVRESRPEIQFIDV